MRQAAEALLFEAALCFGGKEPVPENGNRKRDFEVNCCNTHRIQKTLSDFLLGRDPADELLDVRADVTAPPEEAVVILREELPKKTILFSHNPRAATRSRPSGR